MNDEKKIEEPEDGDIIQGLEQLNRFRDKFISHQRVIMIVGFTILVILVVFLGYARGALDVCNDLGGRLAVGWEIKCHPSLYNIPTETFDSAMEVFDLGELIDNDK